MMRQWHNARRATRIPIDFSRPAEQLESRLLPSVDVLTYHNDNARLGANLAETVLTHANVNVATFGKIGQVAVDGQVYAQPLVKTNVAIARVGTRDVVYVATEHDSVYAFDAKTLAPIWHDSFINPAAGITPEQSTDPDTSDIYPEIGITSTPVIDAATSTMYVVSTVRIVTPGKAVGFAQQLHALDLATGAEKLGGPVSLTASVPGSGTGSVLGTITYQPKWQNQRSALLLSNGVIYIASASFSDHGPYHGWVLGYNAQTLRQTSAFVNTPQGAKGGIWMSGSGLAADDAGNLYFSSGNGTFRPQGLKGDFGDTVTKLRPTPGKLKVADYFTPSNQAKLAAKDLDLGSSGVVLLPDQPGAHPHLLVAGSKEGTFYLLNRDKLGGYASRSKAVQEIHGTMPAVFDTPAYFNSKLYFVGTGAQSTTSIKGDVLKAFSLAGGQVNTKPAVGAHLEGYPGASPSVSADRASNGIVWTLSQNNLLRAATLRAYNAGDITHELYDSLQGGTRDRPGPYVKFSVPTVANGQVFVGGAGTLTLFGILPTI